MRAGLLLFSRSLDHPTSPSDNPAHGSRLCQPNLDSDICEVLHPLALLFCSFFPFDPKFQCDSCARGYATLTLTMTSVRFFTPPSASSSILASQHLLPERKKNSQRHFVAACAAALVLSRRQPVHAASRHTHRQQEQENKRSMDEDAENEERKKERVQVCRNCVCVYVVWLIGE